MKISNLSIITTSLLTSFLLLGCGSDSASTSPAFLDSGISGQLVDNYVENADYFCGSGESGLTDIDGNFKCNTLPVEFRIGGLKLGEITQLPTDGQVFPQDLLGVPRSQTQNPDVIAMARFLQSCDEDNNTHNGLQIRQQVKDSLQTYQNFSAADIDSYVEITVDSVDAVTHLEKTTEFVDLVNSATSVPPAIRETILSSSSILTQDVKDALLYMANEERLAYDTYMELYKSYPLTQFTNIATNGETPHIEAMKLLIQKYITSYDEFTNLEQPLVDDKETPFLNMDSGEYGIPAIQNLYDTLVAKGKQSQQDALEVGCMVEVTDINDLIEDIELAKNSDAADVVSTFEFLRDGSYSHYWAFDTGLKNMGVEDGCCVLGTVDGVNYCHPEYPQNQNSDGAGKQIGKQ